METAMEEKIGVMICGHGSRSQDAVEQFRDFVTQLPDYLPPEWPIEYGYLEFSNPVIRDGLNSLRDQGCNRILAVPCMLFAAMHAKNDIPSVLNAYAHENDIRIDYGREFGIDGKMMNAAVARIESAIADADTDGKTIAREDTCLVVIGRGSSDPDANANIAKIARVLRERAGLGWAEVGYSGVTFPLVQPSLEHAAKLGFKRIVVFPYFLFSGILIDRIYGFTDMVADANPDIQFLKAGYLNDHEHVLSTMADRVTGIMTGDNDMNCSMCKYRAQVLGFEQEIGLPQESHHHHVEGQGASAPGSNVADCTLCDTFCTGLCRLDLGHDHHHGHDHGHDHHHHDHDHDHDHGHHHPVYPHAKHPLGPESARRLLDKE